MRRKLFFAAASAGYGCYYDCRTKFDAGIILQDHNRARLSCSEPTTGPSYT